LEKIDIISLAKNAIAVEITELESLKNRIDEKFEKAVNVGQIITGKRKVYIENLEKKNFSFDYT
jgi:arabinose-5-phosphate isomerase